MRSLAHCGQEADAVVYAQALRKRAPDNAEFLVQVACCYARSAGGADGLLRQQYATQALAALRDAVRHGYRDLVVLRTEPDLEAIRGEPAYRELADKPGEH
jgi:hypothetical protein